MLITLGRIVIASNYIICLYQGGKIMKFEKNLLLIRKRKNYSQEDLALAVGVSRQTIYSWEAGLNSPSIHMLKKIANVLEVPTDDLLNGYSVDRLPARLSEIKLSYLFTNHSNIIYEEIPNWYVKLKCGEDVCFGLYDNGEKDYSYQVSVNGKVIVHDQEGFEIEVKEYDKNLNQTNVFILFAKEEDNKINFIGKITKKNDKKVIETFKDKAFINDWGYNNNKGQSMVFDKFDKYLLEYEGRKEEVKCISYFDNQENKDGWFEVFLNDKNESIYWKRYTKSPKGNKEIDGNKYELSYETVTSRFIK